MADIEIPYIAGGDCAYVTPKLPIASAMEVLAMHKEIDHGQGASVAPSVKPEKFPRPTVGLDEPQAAYSRGWTSNYVSFCCNYLW